MSADVFNKLLELFTILHDIWQRQQRLCGENIPLPQIYANTAPTGCEEWGGGNGTHLSDFIDHAV